MKRLPLTRLVPILCACLGSSALFAELDSLRIVSRLDPNAIIITEVDVVFVYSEDIAENFPATKSDWYSGKFMFTRRAGDAVDVVNTFIPQGFDSVSPILPDRRGDALRVFVIAQHDAADTPPFDITQLTDVLVEIDPFGIRVSALPDVTSGNTP